MNWPWVERRCILCLRDDVPMTRSHLIPESLGGFVWAWTMCGDCNHHTGAAIEAGVKQDDSIRYAVEAVAGVVPDLAREFAEGQRYVHRTEQGIVQAAVRDGELAIGTTRAPDGSIIQASDQARRTIETTLRREGTPPEEIQSLLGMFDRAEVGVPTRISGLTVTHGRAEEFHLPFDGERVSDAFPSLIAFHLLALALGRTVYDGTLNGLRAAIRAGESGCEWHHVERLISRSRGYRPEHLIGIAQGEPHVIVQVRLFWVLVWRVHFIRVASKIEPVALVFDLPTQTLHAA